MYRSGPPDSAARARRTLRARASGDFRRARYLRISFFLLGVRRFHAAHGEFWKPAALLEKLVAEGKKFNAVYLVDHQLGIKVFADAAFYAVGGQDPKKPDVVPFLLKKDAEEYASKNGGKLATYTEVLSAINVGQ